MRCAGQKWLFIRGYTCSSGRPSKSTLELHRRAVTILHIRDLGSSGYCCCQLVECEVSQYPACLRVMEVAVLQQNTTIYYSTRLQQYVADYDNNASGLEAVYQVVYSSTDALYRR